MPHFKSHIMNLIKVLLPFLGLLVSQLISGQSISKSVIGSCGLTQSAQLSKISWSIGETVIGTMTGGQYQLANGFFPSLDHSVLIISEDETSEFINVYPNPAGEFFICNNNTNNDMIIQVSTIDGKEITRLQVKSEQKICLSDFINGVYLLQATDVKTKACNNFKLLINKK